MSALFDQPTRPQPAPAALSNDSRQVVADLSYLLPTDQRPYSYACEPPPGVPWENCAFELRPMPITDARSAAQRPSLDREGFMLFDACTAVKDFRDEEAIKAIYYREASDIALAATGATHAYVFDHLVRKREPDRAALLYLKCWP